MYSNVIIIEEQETKWNKEALEEIVASMRRRKSLFVRRHGSTHMMTVTSELYTDTNTRSIVISCFSAQCALLLMRNVQEDLIKFFKNKDIPCTAFIHIKLEKVI